MIEIDGLTKRYGDKTAVDQLSGPEADVGGLADLITFESSAKGTSGRRS